MKQFSINEGTLDLVKEKIRDFSNLTLSRSEHLELTTLLKVLDKLEPAAPARTPIIEPPGNLGEVLKSFFKPPNDPTYVSHKPIANTSFWIGKKVRRTLDSMEQSSRNIAANGGLWPVGTVVQESITGDLIVDFKTRNGVLSPPLSPTVLELVE